MPDQPDQPAQPDRTTRDPVPAERVEQDAQTYEAAREELVEVVRRLEAGGTGLEESLALWERGERLARRCQDLLDGASRRLDEVIETQTPRPPRPD